MSSAPNLSSATPRESNPPTIGMEGFREDREANRLKSPTGEIEILSDAIQGFRHEEIPSHRAWREPKEWLGSPTAEVYPAICCRTSRHAVGNIISRSAL
jgi:hypothetical protein